MKKLYILCGIPGSGKSTWAKQQKNAKVISRDDIRFNLIKNDEEYFAHETEVYVEFVKRIREAIYSRDISYDIVIADATHLNKFSRTKLLRHLFDDMFISETTLINLDLPIYFCYFNLPLETCIERNNKRTGRAKVPEKTIKEMYRALSPPPSELIAYTTF